MSAPTTDLLGASRPAGAGYDIGAYEFGSVAPPVGGAGGGAGSGSGGSTGGTGAAGSAGSSQSAGGGCGCRAASAGVGRVSFSGIVGVPLAILILSRRRR
jgi:hypothetical protein